MGDGPVNRAIREGKARTSEITARMPELKERVPELRDRVPDLKERVPGHQGTGRRADRAQRGRAAHPRHGTADARHDLARNYARMDVRWARCRAGAGAARGAHELRPRPADRHLHAPRVLGRERLRRRSPPGHLRGQPLAATSTRRRSCARSRSSGASGPRSPPPPTTSTSRAGGASSVAAGVQHRPARPRRAAASTTARATTSTS